MTRAHLHTVEAVSRRAESRAANIASTRPTTRPGSETTDWRPGTPVRVTRSGVSSTYAGRSGYVATINAQEFPSGVLYTEIGVTWAIASDWEKASADAWFRVDELEAR